MGSQTGTIVAISAATAAVLCVAGAAVWYVQRRRAGRRSRDGYDAGGSHHTLNGIGAVGSRATLTDPAAGPTFFLRDTNNGIWVERMASDVSSLTLSRPATAVSRQPS